MNYYVFCLFVMMISLTTFANEPIESHSDINIFLVRHGETIFNKYDRVQGWADTPLTKYGEKVAYMFGLGTKDIHFDKYYSGDLGRQRRTLSLIMQAHNSHQSPVILKNLREVFFGGFEGLPNNMMNDAAGNILHVDVTKRRSEGKLSLTTLVNAISKADVKHDAETSSQVKYRMHQALNQIIKYAMMHKEHNILVVSSGLSIGELISDMTKDPRRNQGVGNAGVVKLTYHNGVLKVSEINDLTYVNRGFELTKN
ncbi:phosphoglycerate mutase [Serratia marcescens]|nr:phosphoglycerate mutase [Serratia marcescens]